MTSTPRLRYAVRVLLLDQDERVLLFRSIHPETGAPFWFPVGGGIEDGEDVRAAAAREVREETGLTGFELGPEVWHRRHVFTWRENHWDQRERWFLVRTRHFEPRAEARTDEEREDLTDCRWWTIAELEATADGLVPRDLPERLQDLLRDGLPSEPVEVGV